MSFTQQPVGEKFLVRNNTAGYIGVVKVNHRGEELGENIEPFGATYLTEHEMMLTARASRLPEDNPFEEQTYVVVNPETQAREEVKMRPLTLESDSSRYVPDSDRYVPSVNAPLDASPDPKHSQASSSESIAAPPSSGAQPPAESPPAPPAAPQGTPGPALRTEIAPQPSSAPTSLRGQQGPVGGQEPESWVQTPERPGEVLSGSLKGSDEGGPAEAENAPDPTNVPPAGQRFVPSIASAQAAPQTPGAEEHAAAVDPAIGEETGAARPPSQPQPEGEYAQAEEVGTPGPDDAPLLGE